MKKWSIALALIVILGVCLYAFRERPLVPEGYTIDARGGTTLTIGSGSSATETDAQGNIVLTLDEGPSEGEPIFELGPTLQLMEYNAGYPEGYDRHYLSIDKEELLAILNTGTCRLSLVSHAPFSAANVQYQLNAAFWNDGDIRIAFVYLGTDSWVHVGDLTYTILNAEELMAALGAAESVARVD